MEPTNPDCIKCREFSSCFNFSAIWKKKNKPRRCLWWKDRLKRSEYFGIINAFIQTYCHVKQGSCLVTSKVRTKGFRGLKNDIRWHWSQNLWFLGTSTENWHSRPATQGVFYWVLSPLSIQFCLLVMERSLSTMAAFSITHLQSAHGKTKTVRGEMIDMESKENIFSVL